MMVRENEKKKNVQPDKVDQVLWTAPVLFSLTVWSLDPDWGVMAAYVI